MINIFARIFLYLHSQIFKNPEVFTLKCISSIFFITVIYKELVTFFIIKPTQLSTKQETIDEFSFPTISLCYSVGLDPRILNENGYRRSYKYFYGLFNNKGLFNYFCHHQLKLKLKYCVSDDML